MKELQYCFSSATGWASRNRLRDWCDEFNNGLQVFLWLDKLAIRTHAQRGLPAKSVTYCSVSFRNESDSHFLPPNSPRVDTSLQWAKWGRLNIHLALSYPQELIHRIYRISITINCWKSGEPGMVIPGKFYLLAGNSNLVNVCKGCEPWQELDRNAPPHFQGNLYPALIYWVFGAPNSKYFTIFYSINSIFVIYDS